MLISVIIFEDNARLRQSLEQFLDDRIFFRVLATYENCLYAAEAVKEHKPQLVVMDIDMPGLSGVEGVKLIKEFDPSVKVIMYTVYDDNDNIFDCICAGADGYLLKQTPPYKLKDSLKEAMEGGSPLSPVIAGKVFRHFQKQVITTHEENKYDLSPRETDILRSLVKGNSYRIIASELFISIDTVKKHLKNIYLKLQVNSGTEAVAKALRDKIVLI
jgi:DNA-binding NarL/FixJ family response regulator